MDRLQRAFKKLKRRLGIKHKPQMTKAMKLWLEGKGPPVPPAERFELEGKPWFGETEEE